MGTEFIKRYEKSKFAEILNVIKSVKKFLGHVAQEHRGLKKRLKKMEKKKKK